jgi:hypothetical protein
LRALLAGAGPVFCAEAFCAKAPNGMNSNTNRKIRLIRISLLRERVQQASVIADLAHGMDCRNCPPVEKRCLMVPISCFDFHPDEFRRNQGGRQRKRRHPS